eukprot:507852-Pelagomonas_calceolata.AAC.1
MFCQGISIPHTSQPFFYFGLGHLMIVKALRAFAQMPLPAQRHNDLDLTLPNINIQSHKVTMGFDLHFGSLAARPAQLFQPHKMYP